MHTLNPFIPALTVVAFSRVLYQHRESHKINKLNPRGGQALPVSRREVGAGCMAMVPSMEGGEEKVQDKGEGRTAQLSLCLLPPRKAQGKFTVLSHKIWLQDFKVSFSEMVKY